MDYRKVHLRAIVGKGTFSPIHDTFLFFNVSGNLKKLKEIENILQWNQSKFYKETLANSNDWDVEQITKNNFLAFHITDWYDKENNKILSGGLNHN